MLPSKSVAYAKASSEDVLRMRRQARKRSDESVSLIQAR